MSENSRINPEVIVIGAGMIGSMITKVLRAQGVKVLLIDSRKQWSGSKCSSGLWSNSLIPQDIHQKVEEGMENLQEYAVINNVQCENLDKIKERPKAGRPSLKPKEPIKRIDNMLSVDWRDICNVEAENLEVIAIHDRIVTCFREKNGQHNEKVKMQFVARLGVFICAGAYTDNLLHKSNYPMLGIDRHWGSCFEARDITLKNSKIKTWAPYMHIIAARISKTIVKFSNGSSVINPPENGDERCSDSHFRLQDHIRELMGIRYKLTNPKAVYGLRPHMPKELKGEFVNQHDRNLFSCTGTGKNTTVLCGYVAKVAAEIVIEWQVADRKLNKVK